VAVTKAEVVAVGAELASIADAEFAPAIARAQLYVDPSTWGVLADEGVALYSAHLLALAHPEITLGDRMPKNMPPPPPEAGALGLTRFGIQIWWTQNTLPDARLPFVC
jgi:hypothetical protein